MLGIQKMAFVDIGGDVERLDDTLRICLASEMFHPEYAVKLSEYSVGSALLARNPFGALLVKINDIAAQLRIPLSYRGYAPMSGAQEEFIESSHEYLNNLRSAYPTFFENQRRITDEINSYTTALSMLEHVNVADIDFDRIWNNRFLKIRFGRLPADGLQKIEAHPEKPYEIFKLDSNERNVWCLYFTAEEYRGDVDKLFFSAGFERLRVPDYVHGTPAEAITVIKESLERERVELEKAKDDINRFVAEERERFLSVWSHVKFLHDAYDLRKFAVEMRGRFHLIGFVLESGRERFAGMLGHVPGVTAICSDAGRLERLPVPVKLKNNWFVRPFEMFVSMYGAPSYHDVDPSPFLAYTYTALFGVMFGDLGQGLCVVLLGILLWRLKRMELGAIMTRIGISSMFVGFWYGSVFGFEDLLDPFFKNVMGLEGKPIEVLHPDTTSKILLVAVGLGAASILAAIVFNIFIGLRRRDFERALLSSNGLCGLVFYASVLFGAIGVIGGYNIFTPVYIAVCVALPLLFIFFREPIGHYAHFVNKDTIISHDAELMENSLLAGGAANIPELFSSPFMTARFGRIPTDSYQKLAFYTNEPFTLYPVKTDQEYIWLIYAMAVSDKAEIDAIFHDLFFERVMIPGEALQSKEDAVEFIKNCVEGVIPAGADAHEDKDAGARKPRRSRTLFERIFPEGFASFFTETFFEMFEVVLSFISNTMSFLRVGGFVLVHAGMMSVVFTLSHMVSSGGATVFIIILGNIFVMLLEGLIVGIQVLRLEFYELFSRFYGASGEPFNPVAPEYPA